MKTTVIIGKPGSGKNLKVSELTVDKSCIHLDAENLNNKSAFAELIEKHNIVVVDEVTNKLDIITRLQAIILEGKILYRKPYSSEQKEHELDELFILSQEELELKLNEGDELIRL